MTGRRCPERPAGRPAPVAPLSRVSWMSRSHMIHVGLAEEICMAGLFCAEARDGLMIVRFLNPHQAR